MKILVTGGCGFIGSHLVDLLIENGHNVRVLDNLSNSTKKYLSSHAEFLLGSIEEENTLQRALEGVDGVFHLAAMVSVPDSIAYWHKNHLTNCSGTIQLLECAKGLPTIFASSAAVYGDIAQLPHNEEMHPRPLSPYAVDKLACEMQLQLAWQLYHTPSVAFRFFNVYGPRQNPSSPYSGVISKFVDRIARDEPVTIYGDGNQKRDFIYVKDVASTLLKAMHRPFTGAHLYNLCMGQETSINALADLIGNIVGKEVKKEYAPPRSGEILHSKGDPSKIQTDLGLKLETPLKEGLKRLMEKHACAF